MAAGRLTAADVRRYIEPADEQPQTPMPPAPGEQVEDDWLAPTQHVAGVTDNLVLQPPDLPEIEDTSDMPPYVRPAKTEDVLPYERDRDVLERENDQRHLGYFATHLGEHPPKTPAPVEGVDDALAYWLSSSDVGLHGEMPSAENIWLTLRNSLEREPTDDEYGNVVSNLPAIVARGRSVNRTHPDWRAEWFGRFLRGDFPSALPEALRPTPNYHRENPNPAFANVRGGPARTDSAIYGQGRDADALATYLERMGVSPALTRYYREEPVLMGPLVDEKGSQWAEGYAMPGDVASGWTALHNFLQGLPEERVVHTAQQEVAHRYEQEHGRFSNRGRPGFAPFEAAVLQAISSEPDSVLSDWFRKKLGHDDAHLFTAPFDLGLAMDDLPPWLRRFYVDAEGNSLLNQNPNYRLARQHKEGHFIGPIPRARIMDVLAGRER